MYNRYIPQPDGSYSRRRMPEQCPPAPRETPRPSGPESPPVCSVPEPDRTRCSPPRQQMRPPQRRSPQRPAKSPQGTSIGSFLKNLLPGDFDTGDLMVVLLLLLMAADCPEDQNNALLTLVLYLFL